MSRSIAPLAIALLTLSLLAGLASPARAATHEVLQQGDSFVPEMLEIDPGDTVRWIWQSGFHTVTSGSDCTPDGMFDAPLDPANPEFSFTFDSVGSFDYFCVPHCFLGMTGNILVTSVSDVPEPREHAPTVAYPNPFSSATELTFALEDAGLVRVEVFDASGRLARVLHDQWTTAGSHRMSWDGTRADGSATPAGIYYGRIVAGGRVEAVHLVKID